MQSLFLNGNRVELLSTNEVDGLSTVRTQDDQTKTVPTSRLQKGRRKVLRPLSLVEFGSNATIAIYL